MKRFRTVFILDILALVLAFALPGALGIASRPGRALTINPLIIRAVLLAYILATWTALMYCKGKPNMLSLRPLNLLYALVGLCLSANFLVAWDVTYRPSWEWLASFGAISFLLLWAVARFCGHWPEDRGRPAGILLLAAGSLFTLSFAVKLVAGYFIWKTARIPLIIAGTLCLCAFYASAGTEKMESFIKKISGTRGWIWAVTGAIVAVIIAATLSQAVLGGIPHVQDSIAMLFQARIFASGKLFAASPPFPGAFDCEFILVDGGKWYGKYFPGFSILLVPGVLARLPWMVNPVIGGLTLVIIFLLARDLFGERVAKTSVLLALLSPFFLFMSASYMSHSASMLLSSLLCFSVVRSARSPRSSLWPLIGGIALGFNLITRPYTALLVTVPAAIYFLVCSRSQGRLAKRFIIALIPVAILTAGFGLYNLALTGDPFLFPFLKYNPSDCFGFGKTVGISHLPESGYSLHKGVSNFKSNLTVLSKDLFGWPRWTFLFMLLPVLSPYRKREDLFLLSLFAALSAGYSLWWYHGICFGARFWYEAMPAYLILAARSLQIACREGRRLGIKPFLFAAAILLFLTCCNLATYFPKVLREYGDSYRWIDRVLEKEIGKEGIAKVLIFVDSKHYAIPGAKGYPDAYLSAFSLNAPDLTGDIVCVRQMDDTTKKLLIGHFPDLTPYTFIHPDPEYSPSRARDGSELPVLAPLQFRE